MSSKNGSALPNATVSRRTLEETPSRALLFLRAVSTQPLIRAAMKSAGYTEKDHAEGWELFFGISGYAPDGRTPPLVNEAERAILELQAWEGPWFQRARAALRRKHPEQEAWVFHGLVAGRGAEAIVAMALFLDRVDALDDGAERKATRKSDHAALATLRERGITKAMLERLRERLTFVRTNHAAIGQPADDEVGKQRDALVALQAWLQDWSDTARAMITRRDFQIRLGLAKRRSRAPKAPPIGTVPAAPPAPAPSPARAERAPPQRTLMMHATDEDAGPASRAA